MFVYLIQFTWRRIVHAQDQDALLDQDYRDWSAYALKIFAIDLSVSGKEHIPYRGETGREDRKLVIMCNHQSQLDIPCLVVVMDRRTGFVAKRELSAIPVLGYFMTQVGCVFIDRSDGRSAHKILQQAAQKMGSQPLVVFPEGTRSKNGALLPLKQGGFRLAMFADAIILPVLIQGTREAGENRKETGSQARIPVTLRMFPAIDCRGLGEGKAAYLKLKEYVEKCWQSPSEPI
jgi:1-acyl-sn-glycerol-3-phosphate acyltransferase